MISLRDHLDDSSIFFFFLSILEKRGRLEMALLRENIVNSFDKMKLMDVEFLKILELTVSVKTLVTWSVEVLYSRESRKW